MQWAWLRTDHAGELPEKIGMRSRREKWLVQASRHAGFSDGLKRPQKDGNYLDPALSEAFTACLITAV